jgi:hypothetical protein
VALPHTKENPLHRRFESAPEKMASSSEFMRLVEAWDPTDRPIHCSNCRRCLVSGDGVTIPEVECARGQGGERSIWQLTRRSKPSGFRAASDCPYFDSMDD